MILYNFGKEQINFVLEKKKHYCYKIRRATLKRKRESNVERRRIENKQGCRLQNLVIKIL